MFKASLAAAIVVGAMYMASTHPLPRASTSVCIAAVRHARAGIAAWPADSITEGARRRASGRLFAAGSAGTDGNESECWHQLLLSKYDVP